MKTGYNSATSWLALIACTTVAFFMAIPMRLSGLFFVILLDGYNTDRKRASVPIVIFGVLRTLTGPFTAVLGETFGFRAVILTGCIFGGIGIGSCYFAEDITAATICLGLIYGIGLACGATLIPTVLKLHFTENINLVNGIWLSGTCVGSLIMSPVITFLHKTYGTNGMFLIVGGIFLNSVPAALLLKHPHNDRRKLRLEDKIINDNSYQTPSYNQNLAFISDEESQSKEKDKIQIPFELSLDKYKNEASDIVEDTVNEGYRIELVGIKNNKNSDIVQRGLDETDATKEAASNKSLSSDKKTTNVLVQLGDQRTVTTSQNKISWNSFRIFADPTYYFIMIVQSFHTFICTLNWTIIVDYARDKGMSFERSVYFVMFLPVSEIFGNLSLNWITDHHFMTRTNFGMTCFLILLLDAGYIIWTYDFVLLMIGVLIFGFVSGAVKSTFPGMIIEQIEEELQNIALASRLCLYAFLCMLKTPIIGYFRGTLGSYNWVYVIIMACSFTCCLLVKLTPVLASCRRRTKKTFNVTKLR